ncbi:IS701 family transposase [Glycomyces dulcitolivorans]|uniref:IS701 family transposase n=1 Tax=Glycomyces dulcitolivorans TaxID=2200759 RepID=UPI00130047B1|nr:IS701 family transposase [Glycomyces dulcitolivorans]
MGAVAEIEAAEVASWRDRLGEWFGLIADDFFRLETRRHAREYLTALLAPVERKNGWQIAEAVGHARPDTVQNFLMRALWDADLVRDRLAQAVSETIGGADAVLVVDDTGFLKQGRYSVGVQRQYTGTSGKVDNCQIEVFAALVSARGRALVDRELYLPASWVGDPDRCRRAGVPEARLDQGLVTKPSTARRMIARLRDAGLGFGWVAADSAYGSDHLTRRALEEARISYVLEMKSSQAVADAEGRKREIANLIAEAPAAAWTRLSQGDGERGPREYDWAWGLLPPGGELRTGFVRSVLARRSNTDPDDIAYFLCFAPDDTSKQQLIRIAGTRWGIETCFTEAKGQCGMDHYQVRTWTSWYRHVTLAMFAHAFLQTTAATNPKGAADAIDSARRSSGICWA